MLSKTLILVLCAYASRADVIQISAPEDFEKFYNDVEFGNSYKGDTVLLTSDIDLCDISAEFNPIGNEKTQFEGTFDGQGHVISNLKFYDDRWAETMHVGMIGYGKGATLRDIVFDASCYMQSQYGEDRVGYAGMLSGLCFKCTIDSVINMGATEYAGRHDHIGYNAVLGGIVGRLSGKANLTNSMNFGSVTFSGKRYTVHVGGLIGYAGDTGALIKNCANYGYVDFDGSGDGNIMIGGIVGYGKGYTMSHVVNMCQFHVSTFGSLGTYRYISNIIGVTSGSGTIEYTFWRENSKYSDPKRDDVAKVSQSDSFDSSFEKSTGGSIMGYLDNDATEFRKWSLMEMHFSGGSIAKDMDNAISLPVFAGLLPVPSKEGYVFDAWYLDSEATRQFNESDVSVEIYANWEVDNNVCLFSGAAETKALGLFALLLIAFITFIF